MYELLLRICIARGFFDDKLEFDKRYAWYRGWATKGFAGHTCEPSTLENCTVESTERRMWNFFWTCPETK